MSQAEALSADAMPAPGERFHVLRRRRIYILPTRQGTAFGGMLLVMLLGSANYNNGLGYALCFLLASLALVSLIHTYRNLAGLGLELRAGTPPFADQLARFDVIVDNRGQRERLALVMRCRPPSPPVASSESIGRGWRRWFRKARTPAQPAHAHDVLAQVDVDADSLTRVPLFLSPAGRRGWLSPERVVIATRYPFGLFRAWSVPRLDARCLIYPAPGGNRPLPSPAGGSRWQTGRERDGEEDFSGLREYRRGDSPRRVNWKALARERGLLVTQLDGGAPGVLTLRLTDTTGPLEQRISQLTRWGLDAHEAGCRYLLDLDGQLVGSRRGDTGVAHRDAALRALALYRAPATPSAPAGDGAWTGGV